MKKIVFIDLDGTTADYDNAIAEFEKQQDTDYRIYLAAIEQQKGEENILPEQTPSPEFEIPVTETIEGNLPTKESILEPVIQQAAIQIQEPVILTRKQMAAQKGFFENLQVIENAIESVQKISEKYDIHFISTAPWSNPNAWSEKRIWIEKTFGEYAFKNLTLTHQKNRLSGDYIIDDRLVNGVEQFNGFHIHFGSQRFPDWKSIVKFLVDENGVRYFKIMVGKFNEVVVGKCTDQDANYKNKIFKEYPEAKLLEISLQEFDDIHSI